MVDDEDRSTPRLSRAALARLMLLGWIALLIVCVITGLSEGEYDWRFLVFISSAFLWAALTGVMLVQGFIWLRERPPDSN